MSVPISERDIMETTLDPKQNLEGMLTKLQVMISEDGISLKRAKEILQREAEILSKAQFENPGLLTTIPIARSIVSQHKEACIRVLDGVQLYTLDAFIFVLWIKTPFNYIQSISLSTSSIQATLYNLNANPCLKNVIYTFVKDEAKKLVEFIDVIKKNSTIGNSDSVIASLGRNEEILKRALKDKSTLDARDRLLVAGWESSFGINGSIQLIEQTKDAVFSMIQL